jgi:predicted metal-dependent phosphoesterase TrpH
MSSFDRVLFEQPDLPQLTKDFTVVDLHFHSNYSDGLNSIPKIAAKARELGIGIAITDHNDIRGALEIDDYDDILSIPGIEITSSEGSHVLVYFYETKELVKFYEKDVVPHMGHGVMSSLSLNMEQIIQDAKKYNCVIIFAHPYCAMYTGVCNIQFSQEALDRLFSQVHGIEVINASNLNKWNLKCSVLGFNLNKSMVGGSDGHSLGHMGRVVSYARCAQSRKEFLDAICRKENMVSGKEIHIIRKVTSNGLKLRSNINNCQDLMEKHFRYSCKMINFKSKVLRTNFKRKLNQSINSSTLRSYFGI